MTEVAREQWSVDEVAADIRKQILFDVEDDCYYSVRLDSTEVLFDQNWDADDMITDALYVLYRTLQKPDDDFVDEVWGAVDSALRAAPIHGRGPDQ